MVLNWRHKRPVDVLMDESIIVNGHLTTLHDLQRWALEQANARPGADRGMAHTILYLIERLKEGYQ